MFLKSEFGVSGFRVQSLGLRVSEFKTLRGWGLRCSDFSGLELRGTGFGGSSWGLP